MWYLERAGVVSLRIKPTDLIDRASRDNARVRQLPGFLVGDVREVATEGCRACMAGEVITLPGVLNQAGTVARGRDAEVAAAPHCRSARAADPVSAGSRAGMPPPRVRIRPMPRQAGTNTR